MLASAILNIHIPDPRLSCIFRAPSKGLSYWKGELPPRTYPSPIFSCKIFVGGVPWDITEQALIEVSIVMLILFFTGFFYV